MSEHNDQVQERPDHIPGQEEDLASGRYVRFVGWLWIVPEVFSCYVLAA
jgi:hypothetical protein